MTSETLATELERYRIGPRIKALRLKKKLGLVQLGDHTGLSPAMLSKIERGQLFPTLPTLLRIAMVFGVDLDHFFSKGGPRVAVTRKGSRIKLPIPADGASAAYTFESLDYPLPKRKMEAFLADFPEGAPASEPHQHGKEEVVYVICGTLQVTIGDDIHVLEEGDAISFDSSVAHSYAREGTGICSALVVTTE
ncbi:XRE family transcriptional regulator [Pseudorhizobium endolithicum]|uniref:XRE family transcriptional regulator n=1 Tax=Pseudorhizobium endolithicum TaxID=1191678 RepID=A0ABM8PG35_9HYPH|nr:XRE family transcriptional regulator [Pseudorhizobium endolithicum]CAD6421692.1 XRE family transcriptional regulator [Rhizobium sp. Q54]CAD7027979.1 XRE family transcriptional regulator [Pseudorhizobium endolithicum]